jgi:cyclophilin family peptidyl-prolyl cis-trans isomerase
MTRHRALAVLLVIPLFLFAHGRVLSRHVPAAAERPGSTPGAGPIVVVETDKGVFEFETYPSEAPRTVEHILALVERHFYDGLRFHRVEPGFVVQVGDPQTRDDSRQEVWGTSGSGKPVGAAEFSRKRLHDHGAVAMAHAGNAARADAQFYITLAPVHRLDGKYTVFGRVIAGTEVPATLEVGDVVRRMYVKR